MKLYQLAPDVENYGDHAGWWLVVSDDLEDELAGPYPTRKKAEAFIKSEQLLPNPSVHLLDISK